MNIHEAENAMTPKPKIKAQRGQYLSTGSTMLNLAISGRAACGFQKGKYFFLVGDSASGKTWLSMSCLAEAANNKNFDDYVFIHDDAEGGANMDIGYYFGSKVAERLEAPAYLDGEPVYSQYVEEFYYHLADRLSGDSPCIYILDSMDSLTTKYEEERFEMRKKKHEEDSKAAGDFADGKAKINSSHLRTIIPKLEATGSILIIINQTRDNLGFGFEKKTRSGGHALKFYAHVEMWSSIIKKMEKTVNGSKREIGVRTQVKVKKNRTTGRQRVAEIPLFHSFGIDDIGSCIDFLVAEKRWTEKSGVVSASDFEFKGRRDTLIQTIEHDNLEPALRKLTQQVWNEIEEACSVKRKKRYE